MLNNNVYTQDKFVTVLIVFKELEASKITLVFNHDVDSELLQKLNIQARNIKVGYCLLRDLIELQQHNTKTRLIGLWNSTLLPQSEEQLVHKVQQMLFNCGYFTVNVINESELNITN